MKSNSKVLKKIITFYAIYGIIYNILNFIMNNSNAGENQNSIGWIIAPIILVLIGGGIYIIAFIYGFVIQKKFRPNDVTILISTILVFIIGVITYYFYPNQKYNYYIMFSGLQAISFFVGTLISKFVIFLENKEKEIFNK